MVLIGVRRHETCEVDPLKRRSTGRVTVSSRMPLKWMNFTSQVTRDLFYALSG